MRKRKVALITGSTSGIGLAIARELAKNNVDIALNGFGNMSIISQIVKEVRNIGVNCNYYKVDISKSTHVKKMIPKIIKDFGGLNILVNNAGIQHISSIEKFDVKKWDQVIATNLSSAFYSIRYTLPYMKKIKWGRIINISSVHGLVASTNKAAYIASKHGIIGLTKAVALETAETNITCNAICPGWVLTPLVKNQVIKRAKKYKKSVNKIKKELLFEKQPSKRFVSADDIAKLANYLCKKESSNITGASWTIDGGWSSQ